MLKKTPFGFAPTSSGSLVGALRSGGRREAIQKVGYRLDWLRFARIVPVTSRLNLVRLGSDYGGYVVPADLLQSGWIAYCAGLGEDITFELELADRFGCFVFAFDPTPRSAAHCEVVAGDNERLRFLPYGLWPRDGAQKFYEPKNPTHVSHSIVNLQQTDDYYVAECRSLPSIMAELGHDRIDLLKMDIEGAEYEVLESMLAANIAVKVLLVDIHKVQSVAAMGRMVERLRGCGYVPVYVHRTDVTFVDARLS